MATSLQYQHTSGDEGRIINADAQTDRDILHGTNASHAPGPMNTRYETFNGHLQSATQALGYWFLGRLIQLIAGTRAGVAGALDPKGRANGEQYLGDVRFSTEDWFDDWEFLAHGSYLRSDFLA